MDPAPPDATYGDLLALSEDARSAMGAAKLSARQQAAVLSYLNFTPSDVHDVISEGFAAVSEAKREIACDSDDRYDLDALDEEF